jgi:hypothetical protein
VSAAASTTDHDSIGRGARTRSGRWPAISGDHGAGIPYSDFQSVESNHREPITRQQIFQTFEQTRLTFLRQDTISRASSRSVELGRRGGSTGDLLGTNAPDRRFAV